jgi:hypothetical protein
VGYFGDDFINFQNYSKFNISLNFIIRILFTLGPAIHSTLPSCMLWKRVLVEEVTGRGQPEKLF